MATPTGSANPALGRCAPEEADVVSEILRVVRLTGDVFLRSQFSEPWSVVSPSREQLCEALMPPARNLFLFHILVDGYCQIELEGGPTVDLRSGEVILFPRSEVHRMYSHAGERSTPVLSLLPDRSLHGVYRIAHGGAGVRSRMVCGYLGCGEQLGPIADVLPRAFLVRKAEGGVILESIGDSGSVTPMSPEAACWLDTTLRYTVNEASNSAEGSHMMLARLTELLFVEILRQYLCHAPVVPRGLMAAISDPHVGKALRIMHGAPARVWTVEGLARAIGVSRAALADRFTRVVGEPPMRYLGRWRMQLAMHQLAHDQRSVAEIAELVGYESEAAFSRAFRRIAGEPPAAWRRSRSRAEA